MTVKWAEARAKHEAIRGRQRLDTAVVTATHVARDWAIEQYGNRVGTPRHVENYMLQWLTRNGASLPIGGGRHTPEVYVMVEDLVEAVWALAELPQQDPLQLVDDTWRGTSDEAREMLQTQYERELTDALNRITWKDR